MKKSDFLGWGLTVLLLGFWEVAVVSNWVESFLLPAPSQILAALLEQHRELLYAMLSTGSNAAVGLLLSAVLALCVVAALDRIPLLQSWILSVAIFFQTVPIVAIAPLLVIWLGFGAPTVQASSAIVAFFPLLASGLAGMSQTPRGLSEVFQMYRATAWQSLTQLRLPAAIPFLWVGLRTASGLAVIGALVGEFVAGGGLGGWIDSARTQQRVDLVFGSVLLSTLLGWFFLKVTQWGENQWNRHQHFTPTNSNSLR